MASPRCTVCSLSAADLLALETAVRSGESMSATGKRYGVSRVAIGRHRGKGHMAPVLDQDAAPLPPPGEPGSALSEMQALVASLKAIDTRGMAPVGRMAVARELRLAVVELAKVAPPTRAADVDLSQSEEWIELREAMHDALLPFPDAYAALLAAIRQHEETHP